jgi:hypothetical protein
MHKLFREVRNIQYIVGLPYFGPRRVISERQNSRGSEILELRKPERPERTTLTIGPGALRRPSQTMNKNDIQGRIRKPGECRRFIHSLKAKRTLAGCRERYGFRSRASSCPWPSSSIHIWVSYDDFMPLPTGRIRVTGEVYFVTGLTPTEGNRLRIQATNLGDQ